MSSPLTPQTKEQPMDNPKIDHLKTLCAVVWLGEKATPGAWRPDDEADVVAPSRIVTLPDGEEVKDWPVASCATGMRDEADEDANADFIAAAANARPALAALLRVVEAAKNVRDIEARIDVLEAQQRVAPTFTTDGVTETALDAEIGAAYSDLVDARCALDAALRDLAPEVEDAE